LALISEKVNAAFNEQIGKELESSYIYLSMSVWLEEKALHNLADWFYVQAKEEFSHAKKFMDYIIETGGKVALPAISKPKIDWQNAEEIVKTAYAHEQYITKEIHKLVTLAEELKEYSPKDILNWFVKEQIEEETNTNELVIRHAALKNDFLFDHHTKRKE
jgi:ferritin